MQESNNDRITLHNDGADFLFNKDVGNLWHDAGGVYRIWCFNFFLKEHSVFYPEIFTIHFDLMT